MKKINVLVLMQEPCPTIIKLIQGIKLLSDNRCNVVTISESVDFSSLWKKLGYDTALDSSVYHKKIGYLEKTLKYIFLHSAAWRKTLLEIEHNKNIDVIQTITPDYIPVLAKKYLKKPVFHHFREIQSIFPHYLLYPGFKRVFVPVKKYFLKKLEIHAIHSSDVVSCDSQMSLQVINTMAPGNKKKLVLKNAPLSQMLPESRKLKVSAQTHEKTIVYHGHINEGALDFIRQLCNRGLQLHIYPLVKNDKIKNELTQMKQNVFFHLHKSIEGYTNFIYELSQYDYGLIPPSYQYEKEIFFNTYLPCKIFDFMAAGLTILAGNYSQIKTFIEEQKAGFIINNPDDVLHILQKSYNSTVSPITIDDDIRTLISLYKQYI
ncbi:MAG: hypothetical protein A2Y62_17095 [Candidatus Fischerbacteria bacterium RBG_13_37_8]|uniref:Glycosyl transferase family 1 domain-containing protein n=1 Tax=Candidatus Fischerbacteria bacterium RBG_13_37_8 TaxID=1817863 RepID=A0A1F5VG18_9BACT|nr:MAG: hypothetical protein A2Y62_17095 [Candidatus Fischerbacteria bacterium RBG_13_37_8]